MLSIQDDYDSRPLDEGTTHRIESVRSSQVLLVSRIEEDLQAVAQPFVERGGGGLVLRKEGYRHVIFRGGRFSHHGPTNFKTRPSNPPSRVNYGPTAYDLDLGIAVKIVLVVVLAVATISARGLTTG
jgi:hypothetical protein